MILKITVTKHSDPAYLNSSEFSHFPLFLGRDEKNDLILPDPLKVVSRRHAKIMETEGILQIQDLETPNFTYLNDEKINPNEENAVKSGDKIKIGDYELVLEILSGKSSPAVRDDDQKTMVFMNPFAEEVEAIAAAMKRLSAKYVLDDSPMKAEILKFSFSQNLADIKSDETCGILSGFLSENISDKKPVNPEVRIINEKKPDSGIFPLPEGGPKIHSGALQDYSFNSLFNNTIDILLDTFAKLIQGFLHFRQEFFGITIYHSIPTGSLSELKEFLFNPEISSEEERKRLGLLKEEIQKLLTHQIGMLEGYRQSVSEGTRSLMETLDPEVIERQMAGKEQSGIDIGKVLPFVGKSKVLDAVKENYRKYISDPYHIEKKFFRPPFLKGYQKRILSEKF